MPIYYLMMVTGGSVRCAEYALNGSEALAQNALNAMDGRSAALLANHGVLTVARTLEIAYYVAEQVEFAAELFLRARNAQEIPIVLNEQEQNEMIVLFTSMGYGPAIC